MAIKKIFTEGLRPRLAKFSFEARVAYSTLEELVEAKKFVESNDPSLIRVVYTNGSFGNSDSFKVYCDCPNLASAFKIRFV